MPSLLVVVAAVVVRVAATVVLAVRGGHARLRLRWVFDPEHRRDSLRRYERHIDGRPSDARGLSRRFTAVLGIWNAVFIA
jgi:hypothetical protein